VSRIIQINEQTTYSGGQQRGCKYHCQRIFHNECDVGGAQQLLMDMKKGHDTDLEFGCRFAPT